jgi:MarR family transcriptional regulator, organic hydroperoxide resistance regulator
MDESLMAWPTGRLLSAAARRIEHDWDGYLETWHLNHASFPVLFLLARSDHSQRELAEAMQVTEQTMSRMLARLERHGYVRRAPACGDRRRYVVTLTPTGARALELANDRERIEETTVGALSTTQVSHLRDALLTLITAPGDEAGDRPRPPLGRPESSDGPLT